MEFRFGTALIVSVALLATLCGCGPSKLAVRPVRYDIDVRLDPATHGLAAQTSLDLARLDKSRQKRGAIDLELHPDLRMSVVGIEGGTVRTHKTFPGGTDEDGGIEPTKHRLVVDGPAGEIRLKLRYDGAVHQDVTAGEHEGQIHNLMMAAHVGTEGIYLAPDGYWYPSVELPESGAPSLSLAEYTLSSDPIPGFELVAGLERDPSATDGRLHWKGAFRHEGLVLLGGPLTRWSGRHGDVELHAVLDPGKEEVAKDVLAASGEYLDRYEPLIGPYPYREFTVLEAFFSSGFAFPGCTQIVGSQISEYQQYRRHGYLDHELLHNWWGNGVLADPRDGNWCEALASYLGNYYGYVLDGDEDGARKQRRNNSNFLSAIKPRDDKPLGTFGLEDGVDSGIGYMKGSAVFHMLERKVGRDQLFAGLRRLAAERMGRHADWNALEEAIERESGTDLGPFFEQWVRRGGAPALDLVAASWQPGSRQLVVTLSQGGTDFALDVPLRLFYGDKFEDVVVGLDAPKRDVAIEVEPSGLTAVELDPDYHVFRKLDAVETMPTSVLTHRAERLVIVVPLDVLDPGYETVIESYKHSVLGEESAPKKGHVVDVREAGSVTREELAGASVLVLGDAVLDPEVEWLLGRTTSPVEWSTRGFRVGEETFDGPGHAVFFTVHHPDLAAGGVTVYFGNSAGALSNARVLGYYPNSLLVFDSPISDEPAPDDGMPRAKVVSRIDFEFHDRIGF